MYNVFLGGCMILREKKSPTLFFLKAIVQVPKKIITLYHFEQFAFHCKKQQSFTDLLTGEKHLFSVEKDPADCLQ